jgi:hypothetical protein
MDRFADPFRQFFGGRPGAAQRALVQQENMEMLGGRAAMFGRGRAYAGSQARAERSQIQAIIGPRQNTAVAALNFGLIEPAAFNAEMAAEDRILLRRQRQHEQKLATARRNGGGGDFTRTAAQRDRGLFGSILDSGILQTVARLTPQGALAMNYLQPDFEFLRSNYRTTERGRLQATRFGRQNMELQRLEALRGETLQQRVANANVVVRMRGEMLQESQRQRIAGINEAQANIRNAETVLGQVQGAQTQFIFSMARFSPFEMKNAVKQFKRIEAGLIPVPTGDKLRGALGQAIFGASPEVQDRFRERLLQQNPALAEINQLAGWPQAVGGAQGQLAQAQQALDEFDKNSAEAVSRFTTALINALKRAENLAAKLFEANARMDAGRARQEELGQRVEE